MRCTKNAWNKFPYPHSRFNFPPSKKNPETSSTAKWFGGKLGGSQIQTWIWPSYNYEQNTQVQGKGLFKNMAFTHVTSTRTTTHTVLQLEGQNSVCCSLHGCHGITKGHIYCLRDFSLIFFARVSNGTGHINYRLSVLCHILQLSFAKIDPCTLIISLFHSQIRESSRHDPPRLRTSPYFAKSVTPARVVRKSSLRFKRPIDDFVNIARKDGWFAEVEPILDKVPVAADWMNTTGQILVVGYERWRTFIVLFTILVTLSTSRTSTPIAYASPPASWISRSTVPTSVNREWMGAALLLRCQRHFQLLRQHLDVGVINNINVKTSPTQPFGARSIAACQPLQLSKDWFLRAHSCL